MPLKWGWAAAPTNSRGCNCAAAHTISVNKKPSSSPRPDHAGKKSLNALVVTFSLGRNKAREISALVKQVSRAEGISTAAVCASGDVRQVCAACTQGRAGFRELKAYLFARANPAVTRWEQRFSAAKRGLHLPAGAQVAHAPGFEDERVTLTLSFRDERELAALFEAVERARAAGRFSPVIGAVHDED